MSQFTRKSRRSHQRSKLGRTHSDQSVSAAFAFIGGAISKQIIEQSHPSQRYGIFLHHLATVAGLSFLAEILGERRVAIGLASGYLRGLQPTT